MCDSSMMFWRLRQVFGLSSRKTSESDMSAARVVRRVATWRRLGRRFLRSKYSNYIIDVRTSGFGLVSIPLSVTLSRPALVMTKTLQWELLVQFRTLQKNPSMNLKTTSATITAISSIFPFEFTICKLPSLNCHKNIYSALPQPRNSKSLFNLKASLGGGNKAINILSARASIFEEIKQLLCVLSGRASEPPLLELDSSARILISFIEPDFMPFSWISFPRFFSFIFRALTSALAFLQQFLLSPRVLLQQEVICIS